MSHARSLNYVDVMESRKHRLLQVWMALAGALALWGTTLPLCANQWLTDYPAAKAQARQQNKLVLINFTGSDWCGWCMRLKEEVFDQPEFRAYAAQNLVLLEVDIPKKKSLSEAQLSANQALVGRYNAQGKPTLVVLGPNGDEIGRTGYRPGGPKPLIAALQQMSGKPASAPTGQPHLATAEKTAPTAPAPSGKQLLPWVTGNARASKPPEDDLRLKSISGPPKRRVALINNETLAAGDDVRVGVGNKTVRVHCIEIRDTSVIIRVDSEEQDRELRLSR
jgi:thiol-disulfide isomerase/thioredoxin